MIWLAFASASLLAATACRGFPFPWRAEERMAAGAEAPPRTELLLQDIRYDGRSLSGRLLLSPVEGRLQVDKRLIESAALSTKSVTDCATGQPVEFMVMDVFARPPQQEEVLVLEPGYWYGKDIRLPLFAETPDGGRSPECIEAELVFHALGGKTAARLQVRAERAARPSADAGIPVDADAGMPADAGR
jgi:hypothetical protein